MITYGLCESIYNWRSDLCIGADTTGPDETDAGAGDGTPCVYGSCAWILRDIQAVPGICRIRGERAAYRIRQCALAGSERGNR